MYHSAVKNAIVILKISEKEGELCPARMVYSFFMVSKYSGKSKQHSSERGIDVFIFQRTADRIRLKMSGIWYLPLFPMLRTVPVPCTTANSPDGSG